MLKKRKYLSTVFHVLIIASALLTLAGCGYKADPFYSPLPEPEKEKLKTDAV